MHLSPDLFEQIVGYRTVRFGDFNREKRLAARLRVPMRITILPLVRHRLTPPQSVTLRELSTHGLSLLHRGRLRRGDSFIIRLPRHEDEPVWVQCSTVRCHPVGPDHQLIGACFDRVRGTLRTHREEPLPS